MGEATISRWNNSGSQARTDKLREAVTAYWDEPVITVDPLDAPDMPDAADDPSASVEVVERRKRGGTRETGGKAG